MKIAYVVGGLPFGGIENSLLNVALELKRRNVQFVIVNLSGTGDKLPEFYEKGIPVRNVCNDLRHIKTFRLDTALKLRRFFKEYSPEIIHSTQFPADYFSRISTIGLKTHIVTHIRSVRVEKRLERRIFNRILSLKTDVFISDSEAVYEMVEKEHNVFNKPHYVLYNAINPSDFEGESNLALEKDKRYLVCVGRLVKLKNFDVVIKAFSLVHSKFPDLRLLIIGEGKERKNLENLVKSLGINGKVIFTGYRTDVPRILKSCHVFLMPSDYEGFGIAHLEAMYAGLPAVISPNVPSREIASECCFISPIKPEAIAEKIEKLLVDEKTYSQFSIAARKAAQGFTIGKYVDKLLELYEGILSGNLPKRKVL